MGAMVFPTHEEWDALSARGKRQHAGWLLTEATRRASPDFEPLTSNERRALNLVAEAFGLDAEHQKRIDGLNKWNTELRNRLSEMYHEQVKSNA